MAVDERARHQLFLRVEAELGPEAAQTMMELLPQAGWADVATKEDLRQLEERMTLRMDGRIESLRSGMEAMESRLRGGLHEMRGDLLQTIVDQSHSVFRNLVVLCSSLVLSVAGIAFAAAPLA